MKKVIGIIIAVMVIGSLVIGIAIANGKTINESDRIYGIVYGKDASEVYTMLNEWIESVGDERYLTNGFDDEKHYKGYGTVDAVEFEKEYGVACSIENMIEVLNNEYDLDVFEIVTAGFVDDYTVYKMIAKGNEPIGRAYDYDKDEYVDYYEGEVYFMVAYKEI